MEVPSIGGGLSAIGNSLTNLGMKLFEADAAREATTALSEAYTNFSDFRAGLEQDYDYATWDERFREAKDKAFSDISGRMKNPIAKQQFEAQYNQIAAKEYDGILSAGRQRLVEVSTKVYVNEIEEAVRTNNRDRLESAYRNNAGKTIDPSLAKYHFDSAISKIDKQQAFSAKNADIMRRAALGEDTYSIANELLASGQVDQSEHDQLIANASDGLRAAQVQLSNGVASLRETLRDPKMTTGDRLSGIERFISTQPEAFQSAARAELQKDRANLFDDIQLRFLGSGTVTKAQLKSRQAFLESKATETQYGELQDLRLTHIDQVSKQIAAIEKAEQEEREYQVNGTLAMIKMQLISGDISADQAIDQAFGGYADPKDPKTGLFNVDPEAALSLVDFAKDFIPAEFKDAFKGIPKMVETSFLKLTGGKKVEDLSPDQLRQMNEYTAFVQSNLGTFLKSTKAKGITQEDFAARVTKLSTDILTAEYKIIQSGIGEKGKVLGVIGGKSAEESAVEAIKALAGVSNDAAYVDKTKGNLTLTPAASDTINALRDLQVEKLRSILGRDIVPTLKKDGKDVKAEWEFFDAQTGNLFEFRPSKDGKTLELFYLPKGEKDFKLFPINQGPKGGSVGSTGNPNAAAPTLKPTPAKGRK